MAFFSCSASALSWSSSFILAKLVGSQSAAVSPSLLRGGSLSPAEPMLVRPLPLARSPPPTDPQASADRPTDRPTFLNLQPAAFVRFFSSFTSLLPRSSQTLLLLPWLFRWTSSTFSSSSSSSSSLAAATLLSWRARGKPMPGDEGGNGGGAGSRGDGGGSGGVVS